MDRRTISIPLDKLTINKEATTPVKYHPENELPVIQQFPLEGRNAVQKDRNNLFRTPQAKHPMKSFDKNNRTMEKNSSGSNISPNQRLQAIL